MPRLPARSTALLALCLATIATALPASAVETVYPQGTLRGFPDLSDAAGHKIADGSLAQWLEGDRLHVRVTYDFADGRHTEEVAILRQHPELAQESWSFEEKRDGQVQRRFTVDFGTRRAAAMKLEKGKQKTWSEEIDVKPGQTFAGIGFALAAMNLMPRLEGGEKIDLGAVAFMPKPRSAKVELSLSGTNRLVRAGKSLPVNVVTIHPKVPWPVKLFIHVADVKLWFFKSPPPQLLRAEEPLAEVSDPIVRVDVLAAGPRLARPMARSKAGGAR